MTAGQNRWARWVLRRRDTGDAGVRRHGASLLAQTLTDQERDRFEDHMRAVLAAGTPARKTLATAYLRAIRP